MDDGTARGWNGQLANIEYLDGAKVKAQIAALESRLSALQQSHGRLLGALRAILDDHDERVRLFKTWEQQVQRVAVMEAARAAIAEATPEAHE